MQPHMSCMLGVMWPYGRMKLLYKYLQWFQAGVCNGGLQDSVLSAAKTLQTRRSVRCLPSLMSSLSNERKQQGTSVNTSPTVATTDNPAAVGEF